MRSKCVDCSLVYDDEKTLDTGEKVTISCPSCNSDKKIKPFLGNIDENSTIPNQRRILRG